ncbi:Dam family site-specific DNA-(adenine-N6)-methyltransferase [unidentified bacterial endosymbiont]|uniref:Dam family site-specific DNA-(adenine-N6)-methyltransferase n=1 Tax=unidentified bacterial endosymbiont TaxID=2355 RepID=UPI00209CDB16|nr:Dam family site-specific DNA-(adenine-N6)-methyltransferase [unidentified bacterial endosymbiont]
MKKQRAFLKWAGGKYRLLEEIRRHLSPGSLLIEPFVGAGSVFLNTDYPEYWLADINHDLINLYNTVKRSPQQFISDARHWFQGKHNSPVAYYQLREIFNQSVDPYQRSLLFLYLNRHGYNGLCRYNARGGFNVPFGTYKKPYFPEEELYWFAEKAQRATFVCENYTQSLRRASQHAVVYCDPPYAPLSATANFTAYHTQGFTLIDQQQLALLAHRAVLDTGATIVISNHDTIQTRHWYRHAQLTAVTVRRFISRQGQGRGLVPELLARYQPGQSLSEASAFPRTEALTLGSEP